MNGVQSLLIISLVFCLAACESPVEFQRLNFRDSGSNVYSPESASSVRVGILEDDILTITWTRNSAYAQRYLVEREIDGSGYVAVRTLGALASSMEDTAFQLGAYCYRVTALYNDKRSSYAFSNTLRVGNWAPGPVMNTKRFMNPVIVRLGAGTIVAHDRSGTEILFPGAKTWLSGGAMLPTVQTWSIAVSNTMILSFGYNQSMPSPGIPGSSVDQSFDIGTGTWQPMLELPIDPFSYLALIPSKLMSGSILISGWKTMGHPDPLRSIAFIYDPITAILRPAATTIPKVGTAACVLSDGRVLLTGFDTSDPFTESDSCFMYDPGADRWSPAASFQSPRFMPRLIALDNGQALLVGGSSSTCELFNAVSNSWSYAANLDGPDVVAAEKMSDTRVFVLVRNYSGQLIPAIYSINDDRWTKGEPWPATNSFDPTASALLPSNRILLTGANTDQCVIFRDR